jgi:hypothetical protein
MKGPGFGPLGLGFLALFTLLALTPAPSFAAARGGSMGGGGFHGQAMHGGGGFHGMTTHGGSFSHGGFHGSGVGFHNNAFAGHRPFVGHGFGHRGFFRPGCCFGSRAFVGFGFGYPFWGYPWGYGVPYPYYPYPYYPYPYPAYAPAVVADSSAPLYGQQDYQAAPQQQQYWYFCRGTQAYYPYVRECPGGWVTVAPQPGSPGPGTFSQ